VRISLPEPTWKMEIPRFFSGQSVDSSRSCLIKNAKHFSNMRLERHRDRSRAEKATS